MYAVLFLAALTLGANGDTFVNCDRLGIYLDCSDVAGRFTLPNLRLMEGVDHLSLEGSKGVRVPCQHLPADPPLFRINVRGTGSRVKCGLLRCPNVALESLLGLADEDCPAEVSPPSSLSSPLPLLGHFSPLPPLLFHFSSRTGRFLSLIHSICAFVLARNATETAGGPPTNAGEADCGKDDPNGGY